MNKHNISKSESNSLYRIFKHTHDLFIKNNISYWVTGGSLLGAIRHNGIIPWDDDGDLCIMKKDVNKLKKLVSKFNKLGYDLKEALQDDESDEDEDFIPPCLNKKKSCTWIIEQSNGKGLGVDIFIMERVGPIITYSDPYWRNESNGGKSCYFFYDFVFPLKPMRFGNFFVMAPNNCIEHLNSCYGVDWNSNAQRLFDHRSGKWINSKKRRMLPSDYTTIKPPKDTCEDKAPKTSCKKISSFKSEDYKNISLKELKFICRIVKLRGYTKLNRNQIIKKLDKLRL